MAVTWTTASLVKKRFNMTGTSLADADIEEFINEAEWHFTTVMKSYGCFGIGGGTFTAAKQGILRRVATAYATLCVITSTSMSFNTLQDATFIADWAFSEYEECRKQLENPDIVHYLKENE